MLNSYRDDSGAVRCSIPAETQGAITKFAKARFHYREWCRIVDGYVRPYHVSKQQRDRTVCARETQTYRHYQQRIDENSIEVGLAERILYAIASIQYSSTAFGTNEYPYYSRVWRKALAKLVLRACKHMRPDTDNPNTHIAFSPSGVKANDKKRRRSLPFAKFIKRHCSHIFTGRFALTDAMLERAAFMFQTELAVSGVELTTGEEAFEIYRNGEIGSCMAGGDTPKHHIEANEGKLFVMVIRDANGRLCMRAKLYKQDDGRGFLDRIYWNDGLYAITGTNRDTFNDGLMRVALHSWLTKNGWNMPSPNDREYSITLTQELGNLLPYCDRINQFDRVDEHSIRFHNNGRYNAQSTGGSDPSDQRVRCSQCHCCTTEFEEIGYNNYCHTCRDECFTYCDHNARYVRNDIARPLHNGGYAHQDYVYELSTDFYDDNQYALTEDSVADYNSRRILRSDSCIVHFRHGRTRYAHDCDETIVRMGDDYVFAVDVVEVGDDYEWRDLCVQLVDESWHLRDDCESITDDFGNQVWIVSTPAEVSIFEN